MKHLNILKREFNEINNIDLVLVDGPFGGGSPFARYSAIPFLKEKVKNSVSVYLDDTNRLDEKEIIIEWQKILKLRIFRKHRFSFLSNNVNFSTNPILS